MTDLIAHAHTPRADTGVSNAQLGMWLFLASDAMLMASLFSAHVLLQAGAPDASVPELRSAPWVRVVSQTGLLFLPVLFLHRIVGGKANARPVLLSGAFVAGAFVLVKIMEMISRAIAGVTPASHVLVASWFVLTMAHTLHVAAGAGVLLWIATQLADRGSARFRARLEAGKLYWYFVFITWLAMVAAFGTRS